MFKRLIIVVLILAMGVFGLVGCGEPNFSDRVVLVVLTKDATTRVVLESKLYAKDDFTNLELNLVTHLTAFSEETLRERLQKNDSTDIGEYRSILQLILSNPSHQTVLQYIEILNSMPDVEVAEPSYNGGIA